MDTNDELIAFGRSLFGDLDNAARVHEALESLLTDKRFDDVLTVVKCAFINTNYFGVKYGSQLTNASIDERYFDRLIEMLIGLKISQDLFMPLIFAAFNPKTAGAIALWARPAREYFLKITYKDFNAAAALAAKFCYGQRFALDVLWQGNPDLTAEYLLEQLKTCSFYQSRLIREFLAGRAPEVLPPKKEKAAAAKTPDINISDFNGLIEFCKSHRDPGTVKRVKQGMRLIKDNSLSAMADYLLCDYDVSSKKTAYLSAFFAKYGSEQVKALLSASIDPLEKGKFGGVLDALDLSMDDVLDEKVDDMELDKTGRKLFVIDGFSLYVAVLNNLQVVMQDEKGSRFTFSEGRVPSRFRLIKKHIDKYIKALNDELKKQKDRMYEAFRSFRQWRHGVFLSNIVNKPLLSAVASEFFWGEYRGEKLVSVFYIENGELFDTGKKPYAISGDSSVALVHPIDLEGQFEFLKRLSMTQPFNQLKRDVFAMPASMPSVITRFHGTVVRSGTLLKRLKKYNWRLVRNVDGSAGAAKKDFPGVAAELVFQNIYPDIDALITIGNAKLSPQTPLRRVYSEIAHDIFSIITDNN